MSASDVSSPQPHHPAPGSGAFASVDRLQLSGPAEIVQIVPYLLGFEPSDSVVLVALATPRNRVTVTVRVDLGEPLEAVLPWFEAAAAQLAERFLVLVYDDEAFAATTSQSLAHRSVVDELALVGAAHDMVLSDALAVGPQRWWSYLCHSPVCCPPDGTAIVRDGTVAAAAVRGGMVVRASRESLGEEIASQPERQRAVVAAIDALSSREFRQWSVAPGGGSLRANRRSGVETIERVLGSFRSDGRTVDPSDAARVLLALGDKQVRDVMMASMTMGDDLVPQRFWADLCRCAPESLVPAPATLYALCCYALGDGARCNFGLDRALTADPGYRLAQLLARGVSNGVCPSDAVPALVEGAQQERARLLRRAQRSGRA